MSNIYCSGDKGLINSPNLLMLAVVIINANVKKTLHRISAIVIRWGINEDDYCYLIWIMYQIMRSVFHTTLNQVI